MEKKELRLGTSKKGLPVLFESGGGSTNTGFATIVAGPRGERLAPIYIRGKGSLSNSDHALFVVGVGMLVIEASHHRRDFDIAVYRITAIEKRIIDDRFLEAGQEKIIAILSRLNGHEAGEWDEEVVKPFQAAINAAIEKATCYHCREPHFMREEAMSENI